MSHREWPAGVNFIKAEIETGNTFADIAIGADEVDKVSRNRTNARKAYDTAMEKVSSVELSKDERAQIERAFHGLRSKLEQLGEKI